MCQLYILLLLFALSAPAQTELFGGFSWHRTSPGRFNNTNLDRLNLTGAAASLTTYQFFPRWGLTAEFEHNRGNSINQTVTLFGGTFRSISKPRFALTGRVLAGTTSSSNFTSQTGLTFGFGQSIDIRLNPKTSLRIQPGLRFTRQRDPSGDTRLVFSQPISFGLSYRFGRP